MSVLTTGRSRQAEERRQSPLRYLPRLLASVIRSGPWAAAGITAITLVSGVVPALQLSMIGRITAGIEEIGGAGSVALPRILQPILFLGAIILIDTVLNLLSPILETSLREAMGIRTQRQVIEKAQSVELVYFEHPDFYDRLQRANQDMGGRLVTLLRLNLDLLGGFVGISSLLVLLLAAHWSLVPIVVLGTIPNVWVALTMNKKTYWVYRRRTPENRLAMYLRGLLTQRNAAKEVRLFTLSEHIMGEWTGLARRLAEERRGLETKQALLGGGAEGISSLAYGACITILAYLILGHRISFEQYVIVAPAILQLANRLEGIMRTGASFQEQSLYLGDLYEFLELDPTDAYAEPEESPDAEAPQTGVPKVQSTVSRQAEPGPDRTEHIAVNEGEPETPTRSETAHNVNANEHRTGSLVRTGPDGPLGEIRFENVWFRYPGSDRFVLKGIDLTLHPGERIALVGENGAGKSTLVRLLLGLYRPTSGRILAGGRDLRELPQEYLHRRMAAVFQDFTQYLFTVETNIALGRIGEATAEEVRRAAELAGVAEAIERLPQGYQTQLGREMDGVDLSGGEWQKLAIARALVRSAELIILDEPTAALDPLAEAEIYHHFLEMTHGRTAVIISHRLGSARMAHRILLLRDGKVAEEGNHDALMALDGEYARLFRLQAQWYE